MSAPWLLPSGVPAPRAYFLARAERRGVGPRRSSPRLRDGVADTVLDDPGIILVANSVKGLFTCPVVSGSKRCYLLLW